MRNGLLKLILLLLIYTLTTGCGSSSSNTSDDDNSSDTDSDTSSDADSDTGSDADSDTGSDADSDTGSDADSDTGSDVDSDTGSDVDSDTGSDADITCVVYVNNTISDDSGNDGRSWATAFSTVYKGINTATAIKNSSENCYSIEVWVASGTYLPTHDSTGNNAPADARTVTFALAKDIGIYGGFKGDELLRTERDVNANETVLSGDIGVSDELSDNSYHVVTGADNSIIDGFTITKGQTISDPDPLPIKLGAGLYAIDVTLSVENCVFTDNHSAVNGGGIFVENSNLTLKNSTFSKNYATNGGGIEFYKCATSQVINCMFDNNQGSNNGGGIYSNISSPSIYNTVFDTNTAHYGGAAFNYDNSSPIFINCLFYGHYEVLENRLSSNPQIINSIIWNNTTLFDDNYDSTTTTTVTYSNVQLPDNTKVYNDDLTNINAAPDFVDTSSQNFRLNTGSAGIDGGSNDVMTLSTDLDGNERIVNTTVDMGPYEVQ
ncbi:MAG: hypothetical protein JXR91_05180 [Deltaproteobacteria bacterium]|nr:hypothetical protein [Deltaproteobacteria bacterium]